MTNYEMVMTTVSLNGLDFDENEYNVNLFTLASWNKQGFKVKKGEKATVSCKIWKPKSKKDIENEKAKIKESTGKDSVTVNRMKLVNGYFFNRSQVEPK